MKFGNLMSDGLTGKERRVNFKCDQETRWWNFRGTDDKWLEDTLGEGERFNYVVHRKLKGGVAIRSSTGDCWSFKYDPWVLYGVDILGY